MNMYFTSSFKLRALVIVSIKSTVISGINTDVAVVIVKK